MAVPIRIVISLLLVLVLPVSSHSQGLKLPRVGILLAAQESASKLRLQSFDEGLRQHGFIEKETVVIDRRYAPEGVERLAQYSLELVKLPVDVILTSATMATQSAKNATNTIPIVFAVAGDPIASGFVASFERPGGNITGVVDSGPQMAGKRLEILKEMIPAISRVAVIGDATPRQQAAAKNSLEATARRLGIELLFPEIHTAHDFPSAFAASQAWNAGAYVTMQQTLTSNGQAQIVELATKSRRALVFTSPEGSEAGALASVRDDSRAIFHSAGGMVAKILKGASPATLPVEVSANPEFVINLRKAKSLGLSIPPAVLQRASRIIQ